MMMIDSKKVENAENYFLKYGKSSTFVGRLIPGIRHLISIPAGLSKMKVTDFILYTVLGAALWTSILTILGYSLYTQKDLLQKYYSELSYLLLALGVLFVVYLVYRGFRKKKDVKTE